MSADGYTCTHPHLTAWARDGIEYVRIADGPRVYIGVFTLDRFGHPLRFVTPDRIELYDCKRRGGSYRPERFVGYAADSELDRLEVLFRSMLRAHLHRGTADDMVKRAAIPFVRQTLFVYPDDFRAAAQTSSASYWRPREIDPASAYAYPRPTRG